MRVVACGVRGWVVERVRAACSVRAYVRASYPCVLRGRRRVACVHACVRVRRAWVVASSRPLKIRPCVLMPRFVIDTRVGCADGSAEVTVQTAGERTSLTCCLAAVLGPRSLPSRQESSQALLDVSLTAAGAASSFTDEAAAAKLLRGALSSAFLGGLHPRTRATVSAVVRAKTRRGAVKSGSLTRSLQVLADDGSSLAAAVTAASAAAADAGLPLKHMLGASPAKATRQCAV